MKQFKIIIISIIIGISINAYGQKFRTIEQYQNYYIANYETLDEIEGIWKVQRYFETPYENKNQDSWLIAIVKDSYKSNAYNIVDGIYDPGDYKIEFYNISYHKYEMQAFHHDTRKTFNDDLYILNNSFHTLINIPEWETNLLWTFFKIFPLESDLEILEESMQPEKSTGTGFAISSDGYIVTNYHVIENAKTIKVKGLDGNFHKSYTADIVVNDKNNDITILKINDYSFTDLGAIPYTIKSESISVGTDIFVLGYPLTATMGEEIKLTNGIISSKSGFQGDITSYQMTAPIQPGNSGAPMFDKNGYLTGIINAKHTGAENAGYAIKITYLLNLIDAAPVSIKLPTINKLSGKSLSTQVSIVKDFIYIIEVN
jgi:S1-C subfamily serine protease